MVHELNDDRPGSLAVVIHWLAIVPCELGTCIVRGWTGLDKS